MNWRRLFRWLIVAATFLLLAFGVIAWRVGTQLVAPANRVVGAPPKGLFDSAKEPKQLVIFEGVAHQDLLACDREKYRTKILQFLDEHLRP